MTIYSHQYLDQIQSISLDNKYTKWYISICKNAVVRGHNRAMAKYIFNYVELHHIIPRCFGLVDKNIKDNQVFLTPKEHFICHHLLVKMMEGELKSKMWFALFRLCFGNKKHIGVKISARQYEFIKSNMNKINQITGKKWFNNGKIQILCNIPPVGFYLGRITKPNKGLTYFTNGEIDILRKPEEIIEGFWLGKTKNNDQRKGLSCWTNGIKNIYSIECPAEGFYKGMWKSNPISSIKGLKCWTNGTKNIYGEECPADGFYLGQTTNKIKISKEKHWFTDGKVHKKAVHCPKGFMLSDINYDREKGKEKRTWFTNGITNELKFVCPKGFWEGRTLSEQDKLQPNKGMSWFNNGEKNTLAFICPNGWSEGQFKKSEKRGLKRWTNGTENAYAKICPEGYYKGQTRKAK